MPNVFYLISALYVDRLTPDCLAFLFENIGFPNLPSSPRHNLRPLRKWKQLGDELVSQIDEDNDTLGDYPFWSRTADLKEGTRIHRYQILGLIGEGGMGAVYKAYDPELDRSIAIKILTVVPQEGETASRPQARLMREAQALAKLNHPNVVAVHDVGTYEDGVYIAMEYVKGKTLREWIKDENPTQKEIIKCFVRCGQRTPGSAHRRELFTVILNRTMFSLETKAR